MDMAVSGGIPPGVLIMITSALAAVQINQTTSMAMNTLSTAI